MRYGLMEYATNNIGDDIQSIAARQYLPRVDCRIQRDYLNLYKGPKTNLILNGWFSHKPKNWPPSPDIDPLFVSFHITDGAIEEYTSESSIKYLKQHEPIGCRDRKTTEILKQMGVDAYFSGCLTLTLKKSGNKTRNTGVLAVDLDVGSYKAIPNQIADELDTLSHKSETSQSKFENFAAELLPAVITNHLKSIYSNEIRHSLRNRLHNSEYTFKKEQIAERLLNKYQAATLVITSRLHVALPCLAYDTPLLFVHPNLDDPRFTGLLQYLNSYTPETFQSVASELDYYDIENPKPVDGIARRLEERCQEFVKE